jgi:hypothetical protein
MEEEILFSGFQPLKGWKPEKRLKRTAGNSSQKKHNLK